MQGQGAEDTGEVDDAARLTLSDEREQGFCEGYLREEVGLEDFVEEVERDIGGAVFGAFTGEGSRGDSGVVDEDVEASVFGGEVFVSGLIAGGACDVEEEDIGIDLIFGSSGAEFGESLLTLSEIA